MSTLIPTNGNIIIEPEMRSGSRTSSIKDFEFAKPKYQGEPQLGVVYAVPGDETEIKPGDRVVFIEPSPKGFKFEDKKLLPIEREKVAAVIG
jgi:hypothetical protein